MAKHRQHQIAVGTTLAVMGAIALPQSASAGAAYTTALANSAHVLNAYAGVGWVNSAQLNEWTGFKTWESSPLWDSVCASRAYLAEVYPGNRYTFQESKVVSTGCSWNFQRATWPGWNGVRAPRSTVYRAKWMSNTTVNSTWQTIGDMTYTGS